MPTDFMGHLLQQAMWVQLWVAWMVVVNMVSVVFLRRTEARAILGVFAGNFVFMNALFMLNGFNRPSALPRSDPGLLVKRDPGRNGDYG